MHHASRITNHYLLLGHQHAHFGFVVLNELSRHVNCHLFDHPGEAEGGVILVGDRFAKVIAAAQAFDAKENGS